MVLFRGYEVGPREGMDLTRNNAGDGIAYPALLADLLGQEAGLAQRSVM